MIIPRQEDWGDLTDLDTAYAYKIFFNKSNQEMQIAFKENIHARCYDLYYMPINVLVYYIYGLKEFIESRSSKDSLDITSAVDCLFNLFYLNSKKHLAEINDIFSEFQQLMQYIADNQLLYDADEETYGDLNITLTEINSNLEKLH